jgi:hypothetical protein
MVEASIFCLKLFPRLTDVRIIIQDFRICKSVLDFNLKLFFNFCII